MPAHPAIEIVDCRPACWGLRAGRMAQERLRTLAQEVGAVTLTPDASGGAFAIRLDGETIWSRPKRGRFPQMGESNGSVCARIAPGRSLGQIEAP
jgi:selenoprotein W-related protein